MSSLDIGPSAPYGSQGEALSWKKLKIDLHPKLWLAVSFSVLNMIYVISISNKGEEHHGILTLLMP